MFRHYRVILRQPAINTLSSYISIPNAAVGNTVYNQNVSLPKHVTQFDKGTDSVRTEPCNLACAYYELPEDDTLVSKHVRAV